MVRFFTLHSEKLMIGADVCPSLAVVSTRKGAWF